MKQPYWNERVKANYPARLKGLGLKPLVNQRGLRGAVLGPANEGRSLSSEEQEAVAVRLKQEGVALGEVKHPISLTRKEYWNYIASAAWADLKQKFLARTPSKACYCCGAYNVPFDLHHKTYARLGAERLTDLCLVCRPCHGTIHALADEDDISVKEATETWRKRMEAALEANLPW